MLIHKISLFHIHVMANVSVCGHWVKEYNSYYFRLLNVVICTTAFCIALFVIFLQKIITDCIL